MSSDELTLSNENPKDEEIHFMDNHSWILKLTPKGIVFNHERFPDYTPDDFAKEFIRILEMGPLFRAWVVRVYEQEINEKNKREKKKELRRKGKQKVKDAT